MADTPVITDVNALRSIVHSLGGYVVPGRSFTFDLPRELVSTVIPKISDSTGLGVRKISERMDEHPTRLGNSQTVCTLELYKR